MGLVKFNWILRSLSLNEIIVQDKFKSLSRDMSAANMEISMNVEFMA